MIADACEAILPYNIHVPVGSNALLASNQSIEICCLRLTLTSKCTTSFLIDVSLVGELISDAADARIFHATPTMNSNYHVLLRTNGPVRLAFDLAQKLLAVLPS